MLIPREFYSLKLRREYYFMNIGERNGSGFTSLRPKNHGKIDTSLNLWQVIHRCLFPGKDTL